MKLNMSKVLVNSFKGNNISTTSGNLSLLSAAQALSSS